jgi:NADPH-dependent curcumin reductase CurA
VVSTFGPMRERFVARASGGQEHSAGSGGVLSVARIDHEPAVPLHLHLSLLSHIGHAAVGIRRIGHVAPGETVVVSAAAGATGSIAAQLAKSVGARVIGIAGGTEKCAWLTDALGLDGAIDHQRDVGEQLAALAPGGIDLFFDNVGGALLDVVLMHLATRARVVVCGSLAQYGVAPENRYRYANIDWLLQRNAKLLPFWISDYQAHLPEDMADLRRRYLEGSLIVKPPHIVEGIEAVPSALALLLTGRNHGKLMVKVGPLPD